MSSLQSIRDGGCLVVGLEGRLVGTMEICRSYWLIRLVLEALGWAITITIENKTRCVTTHSYRRFRDDVGIQGLPRHLTRTLFPTLPSHAPLLCAEGVFSPAKARSVTLKLLGAIAFFNDKTRVTKCLLRGASPVEVTNMACYPGYHKGLLPWVNRMLPSQ